MIRFLVERKSLGSDARRTPLRRITAGLVGAAMAGALMGSGSAQAAASCKPHGAVQMSEAEVSIEVRRLQTTLMVAALTCSARSDYNSFVINHRGSLQKYGKEIRKEFRRRHGKGGARRLNRFVTRLANEASARSNADRDGFCTDATTMFRKVETSRVALATLITQSGSLRELASGHCGPLQMSKLPSSPGKNRKSR